MWYGGRWIKAALVVILITLLLIVILGLTVQLLLVLIPIVLIVLVLSYLFRILEKIKTVGSRKSSRNKSYINVDYKVKK